MRKGSRMTLEQKKRLSEAHKGQIPWNTGRPHSEETRKKLSETIKKAYSNPELRKRISESHIGHHPWNTGKHLSEELKRKLSRAHIGQKSWNKGKKGLQVAWNKGKKGIYPEEVRTKMSEAKKGKSPWNKGIPMSKELRKKSSESHKGQMAWNKGLTKENNNIISNISKKLIGKHPSEETRLKIKKARAEQIFPIKDSKPEIKIQNFLQRLGITFLKHKHIKEIEHSYQCDIFIPSMNLIIECDGDYWHKYPAGRDIDKIRTFELIEKGFKVLRLWERDIKKMNLNNFKEKINPFENC